LGRREKTDGKKKTMDEGWSLQDILRIGTGVTGRGVFPCRN